MRESAREGERMRENERENERVRERVKENERGTNGESSTSPKSRSAENLLKRKPVAKARSPKIDKIKWACLVKGLVSQVSVSVFFECFTGKTQGEYFSFFVVFSG